MIFTPAHTLLESPPAEASIIILRLSAEVKTCTISLHELASIDLCKNSETISLR